MSSNKDDVTPSETLIGRVKWFNNSLSYGFVTVITEGKYHNTDVFVHQSNLQTKKECFRTLFTGECIQFVLTNSTNEKHPLHAVNVTGYNGNPLHCEASIKQYNNSSRNDGGSSGGDDGNNGSNGFRGGSSGFRGRGGANSSRGRGNSYSNQRSEQM